MHGNIAEWSIDQNLGIGLSEKIHMHTQPRLQQAIMLGGTASQQAAMLR